MSTKDHVSCATVNLKAVLQIRKDNLMQDGHYIDVYSEKILATKVSGSEVVTDGLVSLFKHSHSYRIFEVKGSS